MVIARARQLLPAFAFVALLLTPLATAKAAATRGMWAPEIDARATAGDAPVLLESLRGRMVLLEFFGTDCPHCQRAVPRMNQLHARFGPRGLTLLGLSPDSPSKITAFAHRHGVRHPLARAPMDALRVYSITNYPQGVLVGPEGRILWRGQLERLTDRVLEAYLGRVRIAPQAPVAFAAVEADRRAGRYGAVASALDKLRACRQIDRASCRYVLDTLAWVAWHKAGVVAAAGKDEARGRWASAVSAYDAIATAYPGTELATQAAAARARILSDETRARNVRAAHALTAARRAGRWEVRARQLERLQAVARDHAGTKAGSEARALIARLTPGAD